MTAWIKNWIVIWLLGAAFTYGGVAVKATGIFPVIDWLGAAMLALVGWPVWLGSLVFMP